MNKNSVFQRILTIFRTKRGVLLKNTLMLYVLTFSTYLIGLLLFPYETNVLGADHYRVVGVSANVMRYFQLVVDFGFLLSATEEVSKKREDKAALGVILTSVTLIKLILMALCFAVLMIVTRAVEVWRDLTLFFILDFFAVTAASLLPDYLYRGIEDMTAVTVRTVLIRIFSAVLIVLTVKKPGDELLIPAFTLLGNALALIFVYIDVRRRLGIRFERVKKNDVILRFRTSGLFFFSRIATTLYTVTNTVVLDIAKSGNGIVTSSYTAASKVTELAKNGVSPISDSLYPYMVKNRDFSMVKRMLWILEPIIVAGCVIVGVFAEPICSVLGKDFTSAAAPLRALLPVIAVILPSYIFGFPVMGAMGINKYANYSTIVGSVIHVIVMAALLITGNFGPVSAGLATSFTETVILVFRVVVVYKHRHLLRSPAKEEDK